MFVVVRPHPSGLSAARYALRAASARASGPPLTRPRAAAGDLKGTEHPGWLYAASDSGEKGLVPDPRQDGVPRDEQVANDASDQKAEESGDRRRDG